MITVADVQRAIKMVLAGSPDNTMPAIELMQKVLIYLNDTENSPENYVII